MTSAAHTDPRLSSIALVDMGYLFKTTFVMMSEAPVADIARSVLQRLDQLRQGVGHVIVCRDAPPYSREGIFPEYKANRPKAGAVEIQAKKAVFSELQRLGFNVAWCQGFEADDVIATLAKAYSEWCPDVRIVGPDKDMAQCLTVSRSVRQFIPPVGDKDWVVRDWMGVHQKWGVTPDLMPFYQALTGDKTDNVPGVPGIGPVNAKKLVNQYPSAAALAAAMSEAASTGSVPGPWAALAQHYESGFILSLKLVTLATNVPLDLESLLVPRAAEPTVRAHNTMDVELDGLIGNETPMPPAVPEYEQGLLGGAVRRDPETDAVYDNVRRIYDEQQARAREQAATLEAAQPAPEQPASPSPAQQQIDAAAADAHARKAAGQVDSTGRATNKGAANDVREPAKVTEAEFDPISRAPGATAPLPPLPPKPAAVPPAAAAAPPATPDQAALAKTSNKWGLVNEDLQPQDLQSAYTLSKWLKAGGLYRQYENEAQIFTVILQGRELGVGVTVALANTHVIDGKPVKHADFIRAMVERDPTFEYLMPVEMTNARCVWEGKRKGHPRPVQYTYTMEDAKLAGLCRDGNYGKPGNWEKRPMDMLNKTAASKLARLLWPGATMGLYCPEEFGYAMEDLSQAA